MSGLRIIVGPESMRVERHGISSDTVPLTAQDGQAEVRAKAATLWGTIRPYVSWRVWLRHRLTMWQVRAQEAHVRAMWPGPYYPGPRPDLIATRPWATAVSSQWTILPHGVVSRLLRQGGAT